MRLHHFRTQHRAGNDRDLDARGLNQAYQFLCRLHNLFSFSFLEVGQRHRVLAGVSRDFSFVLEVTSLLAAVDDIALLKKRL